MGLEETITEKFCHARTEEISRRFASLDVRIDKLFDLVDRLPAWGTVTIAVLSGLLGASLGCMATMIAIE